MPIIGTQQSPIHIVTSNAIPISNPQGLLEVKYEPRKYHGKFLAAAPGHGNFEFDPPYPVVTFRSKSDASVSGEYELLRIHIHLKSEHVIDSTVQRDYEVHLLHIRKGMTLSDPKLAIGILYDRSAMNPSGEGLKQFNEILKERAKAGLSLRHFAESDTAHEGDINPCDFFPRMPDGQSPDFTNWFHYEGSLTSDPYSEDVSWFVMKNEVQITNIEELKELLEYAEQEARQTYALNRRIVLKSFE